MEAGRGHDNGKAELSEKVARAVAYYTARYGATPTLCFVNPDLLKQAELKSSLRARPAAPATAPVVLIGAPRRKKMDVQG